MPEVKGIRVIAMTEKRYDNTNTGLENNKYRVQYRKTITEWNRLNMILCVIYWFHISPLAGCLKWNARRPLF